MLNMSKSNKNISVKSTWLMVSQDERYVCKKLQESFINIKLSVEVDLHNKHTIMPNYRVKESQS